MDKIKEIIDLSDFLSGRDNGYKYYLSPFLIVILWVGIDHVIYPFPEGLSRSYNFQMMYIINFFHDNFSIDTLEIIGNIMFWITLILFYLIALGSWNRYNYFLEYFKNNREKLTFSEKFKCHS